VVNDEAIELTLDLSYVEQPIQILEHGERELLQKRIPLIKVLWNHHLVQDATWESEIEMRQTSGVIRVYILISRTKFF
jgi:hypothetical protein